MPLPDALQTISKLGFTNVDLICIPGFGHLVPEDVAADFDAQCENVERLLSETKLTPVAINSAYGNLYQRDDAEANKTRLAQVDAVARLAKRLNVGVVSFFPGGNWPAQEMNWDDVLTGEVETLREMLEAASKHDVEFVVEPHFNTPFQTLDQITKLLAALPQLHIAYDPSHFAMQEIPLAETAPFLDRATHVHMRDAGPQKMQMPTGEGTVDFSYLMGYLKKRSYDGAVSIEYLAGIEGGAEQNVSRLREMLQSHLD
jgi:sugar phosphate isomerase/epimerase